jgi:hypothetical protein
MTDEPERARTISSEQASAMLADVDGVVRRVKQSRIYRRSGDIFIVWGALQFAREALFAIFPRLAVIGWFSVDLVGIVLTVLMLRRDLGGRGRLPLRVLATFALFYGFGWLWADVIGAFGPRQLAAFWPTLFDFGYAVVGLWFGAAFLVIGLGAAAATVAAFLWASDSFWLALSIINGGALILIGLWMRRA